MTGCTPNPNTAPHSPSTELAPAGSAPRRAAPGEFIGEWQWDGETLVWETDFRATADREIWGWATDTAGDEAFNDELTNLTAELQRSRRWG